MIPPSVLALKALFHSRKISMDRKFSENIIVKSWKFSTSKFFSDGKFVSANHILQNVLSAENFPEWKWALRDLILFHSIRFCDLWHWVWYSSLVGNVLLIAFPMSSKQRLALFSNQQTDLTLFSEDKRVVKWLCN